MKLKAIMVMMLACAAAYGSSTARLISEKVHAREMQRQMIGIRHELEMQRGEPVLVKKVSSPIPEELERRRLDEEQFWQRIVEMQRIADERAQIVEARRQEALAQLRIQQEKESVRHIKEAERVQQAVLDFQRERARKGAPSAQRDMGKRYLAGDGVAKDEQEARRLLGLAAAQGDGEARSILTQLQ